MENNDVRDMYEILPNVKITFLMPCHKFIFLTSEEFYVDVKVVGPIEASRLLTLLTYFPPDNSARRHRPRLRTGYLPFHCPRQCLVLPHSNDL
jgi:hypothetical protein